MRRKSIKKVVINSLVIMGMIVGIMIGFPKIGQVVAAEQSIASNPNNYALPESETGLYIVQLSEPSISLYGGGIAGLEATSPEATGVNRLDPNTQASQAYLAYLNTQQQNLVNAMTTAYGHPIEVQYYYQYTLNAIAVSITHSEALQAFNLPDVKAVYADKYNSLDTDMGPTLIGAPYIWNGDTIGDIATKGEGIVIGMIDSGINHAHPSFAEVGPVDGYVTVNPYGDGVFHGDCLTTPGFCNNKLIAAYDLYPGGSGGPEDTDGHGSHTSSTAGGNTVIAQVTESITRTISGVAPHANLVAYKVCNPSCPSSSSVEAVNLAIGSDSVNVINYSISGGDSPWTDPVDQAFLDAFAAGIFVSASAGNNGPGYGTVAHTGPWNSSVAASTHSRIFANNLDVTAAGGDLTGLAAVPGDVVVIGTDVTAPILYAGDVDPTNVPACNAFPADSFTGKIGLAQRGGCTFEQKVTNLYNAGAVGAVIFNNAGGPPTTMGSVPMTIPSVMITQDDGLAVVALISGDPTADVTIYAGTQVFIDPAWQDIMAGFSSRGPSQFELLKPDYTGPGVNILAAVAASDGDPVQYGIYQGTSMSSPHSAGSAALMMALRPGWTIAEIRSAMDSTSDPTPVKDPNGIDPANAWEMGSGRLALGGAGNTGLVLDESVEDYIAANPAVGGDPKTLNQPSMVNYACPANCQWTRYLTNVLPTADTWTVSTSGDPMLGITVDPPVFSLDPGETVVLHISANVSAGTPGDTLFGDVMLTPTTAAATHLPVVTTVEAAPVIAVDPTEFVSNQPAELVTDTLTISNLGNADLTWDLYDGIPSASWSENFDSYETGSQMHGQGGWKGWGNNPAGGALTSDAQFISAPNSVAILGASDLVHEYTDFSTGVWSYTAWQYIPTDFTGSTYFILLNQYDDGGATDNWSTEVVFDNSTGLVSNDGPDGGTLPLIKGEWVKLQVDIDLNADTQSFYYGGDLLFSGSWTDGLSGGGIANVGAVDLFANNASVVYYDDLSLLPTGNPACGVFGNIPWLSTSPESGTTLAGDSSMVDVYLDGTGLPVGVYTATLCAESNDAMNPLIPIPVTMNVLGESDLTLMKTAQPDSVSVNAPITYTLSVSNTGPMAAPEVMVVDTLPDGVTFDNASEGCVEDMGVVTCDIGTLNAGEGAELTIVVTSPAVSGVITNTATVSGNVTDPNPDNNTATVETMVLPNIYLPLVNR